MLQHGSARLFVPSAATLLLLQESDWSGARQVTLSHPHENYLH